MSTEGFSMADLDDVRRLAAMETGLCTLACSRADGTAALSVVNAGVLAHPLTGAPVVGLVTQGGAKKLAHLRARPHASVAVRRGWAWVGVEGPVELVGPEDPLQGFDPADLPWLLRAIFTAAGGTHDDWDTFDRVMRAEGRTAVLIDPDRIYGRPPSSGADART
jgi:PPOX class probable F420-dependent enzyme